MNRKGHEEERTSFITHKTTSPSSALFPAASKHALVEALFASIGDGAIATDEFGKIVRVNATALNILGFKENEVLGEWFPGKIIALHENDTPVSLIERPITKAFLTGDTISEKVYFCHKKGQKIPVAITISPIILNGKPVGAFGIFRDITQEHEIDRMKSEFISLASHQLRTPLASVKTYSHMLIDGYMGEMTSQQRSSLHTIVEATDRMNQLISTLLNISRIESDTITLATEKTNMVALANEIVKEFSLPAEDKHITLKLIKPSHPLIVRTDKLIVKEILSNLLSNAIKYTPDRGTVTMALEAKEEIIVCSVTDTGLGIPKDAQEQIFSKFFRAPNVESYDTAGTGLGLYLVKGLADRLGAKIWLESKLHSGSTFYFALSGTTLKT